MVDNRAKKASENRPVAPEKWVYKGTVPDLQAEITSLTARLTEAAREGERWRAARKFGVFLTFGHGGGVQYDANADADADFTIALEAANARGETLTRPEWDAARAAKPEETKP